LISPGSSFREDRSAALSSIGAVLFDVDGTLYAQPPLRLVMMCEMGLVCGMRALHGGARVPRIIATFRRMREELRAEAVDEHLERRQHEVVAARLQCDCDEVERIVEEWIYRRPLKWMSLCRRAGVLELLEWLDRKRVPRGILSDYPAHDKLEALGVGNRFDVVLSAVDPDVGVFKPHPQGFIAAARKLGVAPDRVLYVGDRLDVDAAGAAAAGMRCAVLTRTRVTQPGVIGVRDFRELQRVLAPLC
jgi:HAD superfamily hydrolase (TIGR01509 family)